MAYQYDIRELARGASAGNDHIGDFITLALAERIEALVDQLTSMNSHVTMLDAVAVKMDALVQATKDNKPKGIV